MTSPSSPPYYFVSIWSRSIPDLFGDESETHLGSHHFPNGHTTQCIEASYHNPSSAYMEEHSAVERFRIRLGRSFRHHRIGGRVH